MTTGGRGEGLMSALGEAAEATMQALLGEAGVAEDAPILISQLERARRLFERSVSAGDLFVAEPAQHAAALLRLAAREGE